MVSDIRPGSETTPHPDWSHALARISIAAAKRDWMVFAHVLGQADGVNEDREKLSTGWPIIFASVSDEGEVLGYSRVLLLHRDFPSHKPFEVDRLLGLVEKQGFTDGPHA